MVRLRQKEYYIIRVLEECGMRSPIEVEVDVGFSVLE